MTIDDHAAAEHTLEAVGYYRLSGYWYPYREPDHSSLATRLSTFAEGTRFSEVAALYAFDRDLKSLVLSGIERVEVALRSRTGYLIGEQGALAHADRARFRPSFDHASWWKTAQGRARRARGRDDAVDHHYIHYGGDLPIWVLTDLLDFSDLSKLYAGMRAEDQRTIAEWFKVTVDPGASKSARQKWAKNPPLVNWLEHLSIVRNICAHHGRLWNRQLTPLGVPQRIRHLSVFDELVPTFDPQHPEKHQSERVFGTICVVSYLLGVLDPENTWREEVDMLVATSFPAGTHRSQAEMGFPGPAL